MDTEVPNTISATCSVAQLEDQFLHLRIPGKVVKNCLQCRQRRNAAVCTLHFAFTYILMLLIPGGGITICR